MLACCVLWPMMSALHPPMRAVGGINASASVASLLLKWTCPVEQSLRETGWVEGRNIVIEYRSAQGRLGQLADLHGKAAPAGGSGDRVIDVAAFARKRQKQQARP